MNKTEREAVEDFLEWFNGTALDHIPNGVFQRIGRQLRDRLDGLLQAGEKDIYLVVCENGFARGTFAGKSIPEVERCARLRNELCACGSSDHQIIRAVQQGTGRGIA